MGNPRRAAAGSAGSASKVVVRSRSWRRSRQVINRLIPEICGQASRCRRAARYPAPGANFFSDHEVGGAVPNLPTGLSTETVDKGFSLRLLHRTILLSHSLELIGSTREFRWRRRAKATSTNLLPARAAPHMTAPNKIFSINNLSLLSRRYPQGSQQNLWKTCRLVSHAQRMMIDARAREYPRRPDADCPTGFLAQARGSTR